MLTLDLRPYNTTFLNFSTFSASFQFLKHEKRALFVREFFCSKIVKNCHLCGNLCLYKFITSIEWYTDKVKKKAANYCMYWFGHSLRSAISCQRKLRSSPGWQQVSSSRLRVYFRLGLSYCYFSWQKRKKRSRKLESSTDHGCKLCEREGCVKIRNELIPRHVCVINSARLTFKTANRNIHRDACEIEANCSKLLDYSTRLLSKTFNIYPRDVDSSHTENTRTSIIVNGQPGRGSTRLTEIKNRTVSKSRLFNVRPSNLRLSLSVFRSSPGSL